MRNVTLGVEENLNPYYTIMKFGCGPHFVLNRSDLFERMIISQGVTFWFRFWLTFCLNPSSYQLKSMQEQLPNMMTTSQKHVHIHFLDGSDVEKCQYCLALIKSMCKQPNKKLTYNTEIEIKTEENSDVKELSRLLTSLTEMAFGAALCEVFYKWLNAVEIHDNGKYYWEIPVDYLNPKFKPQALEKFFVKWWREDVETLLGVPKNCVPWISRLLEEKDLGIIQIQDPCEYSKHTKYVEELTKVIKKRKQERVKMIDEFDEQLKKVKSSVGKLIAVSSHGSCTEKKTRIVMKKIKEPASFTFKVEKRKFKKCYNCLATETTTVNNIFQVCKRCQTEEWETPRFYCSANCRVEHWFKTHHKEHLKQQTPRILHINELQKQNGSAKANHTSKIKLLAF